MWEVSTRPAPLALVLLGLLVVGLVLLVWLPRRVVPGRSLALFRVLLPSWRFFEQLEPTPALGYRVAPHGDDWSDWQVALHAPPRTLSSLWLNAAGNLNFACQSLVEHLVVELDDAAELGESEHELTSYRLVCALVEERLSPALRASPALRYQFRLAEAGLESKPLFLSQVHGSA